MKKQILLLTFFVAAILAGNNTFAQDDFHYDTDGNYLQYLNAAPTCITPRPLQDCDVVDELHPNPGQPYEYIVNTTDATDDVRWFVVNYSPMRTDGVGLVDAYNQVLESTSLMSGTGYIDDGDGTQPYILEVTPGNYNQNAVAGDGSGITSDGTTAHSIEITWKYFSGLTTNNEEILLVAYVQSDDQCTDNIIVYRIIPTPAFTLDVAVLSQTGDSVADRTSTSPYWECVSPIESAIYDPGRGSIDPNITPGDSLIVDYGENWVYFMVTAANYVDSWLPNFFLDYNSGDYEIMEASWAYAADANANTYWNTIANWADSSQTDYESIPVIAAASGATAGAIGAGATPTNGSFDCIVVRVRLDWGIDYEHDEAPRQLYFEVDGRAYDGGGTTAAVGYEVAALGDLHDGDCTVDYFGGDTHDGIYYEITPRPEVENAIATPVDHEDKSGEEN